MKQDSVKSLVAVAFALFGGAVVADMLANTTANRHAEIVEQNRLLAEQNRLLAEKNEVLAGLAIQAVAPVTKPHEKGCN